MFVLGELCTLYFWDFIQTEQWLLWTQGTQVVRRALRTSHTAWTQSPGIVLWARRSENDPQNLRENARSGGMLIFPCWGGIDRWMPGAFWPTILALTVNSRKLWSQNYEDASYASNKGRNLNRQSKVLRKERPGLQILLSHVKTRLKSAHA